MERLVGVALYPQVEFKSPLVWGRDIRYQSPVCEDWLQRYIFLLSGRLISKGRFVGRGLCKI